MRHIILVISALVNLSCAENESSCNIHATILRQLEREGFHLEIHSLVELVVDVESAASWENCTLLLKENISEGYFVNPDQLSDLSRSGVIHACTNDLVDIEAPQHLASRHTAYVYSPFLRSQNLIYSHVKFPLHLRYQKPKREGGYSPAVLEAPSLLMHCKQPIICDNIPKVKAPCFLCSNSTCNWMKFPYQTNAHNFTLPVPVGNLDHYNYVMVVTYLLTFGSCFYILLSLANLAE